jgi:hypothetical protein
MSSAGCCGAAESPNTIASVARSTRIGNAGAAPRREDSHTDMFMPGRIIVVSASQMLRNGKP